MADVPSTNPWLSAAAEPEPASDPVADVVDAIPVADVVAAIPSASAVTGTLVQFFKTLVLYIPNALVLFGFIIDIINQELRYSIASFIGIASVFLNFLVSILAKTVLKGSVATGGMRGGFSGCTVPGFESIESMYAPQGLVLPAAIFMYLIMDYGTHRSASQNIGLGIILPGILVAHSAFMWSLGCFDKYYWKYPLGTVFAGFAVGALCGITGWGVVRTVAPSMLPTAVGGGSPSSSGAPPNVSPGDTPNVGPGGTGPLGSRRSPGVGTCSAPNDQDQFVCEAYRNGKLVTTTIAE